MHNEPRREDTWSLHTDGPVEVATVHRAVSGLAVSWSHEVFFRAADTMMCSWEPGCGGHNYVQLGTLSGQAVCCVHEFWQLRSRSGQMLSGSCGRRLMRSDIVGKGSGQVYMGPASFLSGLRWVQLCTVGNTLKTGSAVLGLRFGSCAAGQGRDLVRQLRDSGGCGFVQWGTLSGQV